MRKARGRNFKAATKTLFLKYAIIPILILILLFTVFTILLLNIKTIYDTKKSAKNLENEVSELYANYVNEIERMIQLPQVLKTIERGSLNHHVYEEFYNFNNRSEVKSIFHLIDKRNVFLVSTAPAKSEISQEIIDEIIPYIEKNPDEIYINAERTELSNGHATVFDIGTAVVKDDRTIGYVVYQLFEKDFQELIYGENADIAVLTDYYDYIIATTNSITTGLMNKFNPKKVSKSHIKLKEDKYYLSKLRTKDQHFTIYTANTTSNDIAIYIMFFAFIIITGIMIYILLVNMAEKMSTKNANSIEKLMNAVTQLEQGNMKAYVSIKTGDEFELLADQYNNMLDNLNKLIKSNEELSNIRRVKEIKLLESQFNPHFLFNILETLKYTMLIDIDKAQDMILSLSRVLRYSLDTNSYEVLFEKDLDYIVDFLKLHKLRFGDQFDYAINMDRSVKKASVPKLLLQPIIENAIKYGYQTQTHLSIQIEGKVIDDTVIFKVCDDGAGIEKGKLQKIRKGIYSTKKTTQEMGIGLYNTNRRIILQYGESYGLTMNSNVGKGTEVIIKLPYKRRDLNS